VNAKKAVAPPAPTRAKKSKGAPALAPAQDLLEVILHDTVLFPEGGGQPSDTGRIAVYDDEGTLGADMEVVEIKRNGGTAIHYVQAGEQELSQFPAGARVHVWLGEAGVARRLDHVSTSLVMEYFIYLYLFTIR
jgi:misacylated tRNA(Ala) deacylase